MAEYDPVYAVRVPRHVRAELERLAQEAGIKPSEYLRLLLRAHVESPTLLRVEGPRVAPVITFRGKRRDE